jgi:hypothetical protein
MKRTILFSLLLSSLIYLPACQKEGSTPSDNYYFEATIDGSVRSYPATPTAVMLDTLDFYSLGLAAYTAVGSNDVFALTIAQKAGPVTTGTYIDDYTNEDRIVGGGFNLGATDDASQYGAGLDEGPDPKLTITITELTDKTIKGTFSGTFFDHGGEGPGKVAVTDGKFYLPLFK